MNSSKFAEQRAQPGTSKAGLKWTPMERLKLFESMRAGIGVDAISKLHERTPGAIQARMNKEFVDAVHAGETPAAVASRLKVPVDAVVSAVMKAEDLKEAGPSMKAQDLKKDTQTLKKTDPAKTLSSMINSTTDPAALRSAQKLIESRLLELCPPDDESDPDSVAPVLRGFAFKPRARV
jgi:hypothetical protein